jgi:hypothetical protein
MCAQNMSQVIPFVRSGIEASKVMITIFFAGMNPLVLDVLPTWCKFDQPYLLERVQPLPSAQKLRNHCEKPPLNLTVQMDDSVCHAD